MGLERFILDQENGTRKKFVEVQLLYLQGNQVEGWSTIQHELFKIMYEILWSFVKLFLQVMGRSSVPDRKTDRPTHILKRPTKTETERNRIFKRETDRRDRETDRISKSGRSLTKIMTFKYNKMILITFFSTTILKFQLSVFQ